MMDTGGLLSLHHPGHAEVAEIGRDWYIFADDAILRFTEALHDTNPPFIGFEAMLLLTGKFARMASTAPFVIDIKSIFHQRVSFL
jgi:hypothetical protein